MKRGAAPSSKDGQEFSWRPSYTIREASRMAQLPARILRYWEDCRLLSPARTIRGHRRYRESDVERILKIKELFYVKGMRLEGARKALIEEARKRQKSSELPLELATQTAAAGALAETKQALKELLAILR